jgi:transposase-like protein
MIKAPDGRAAVLHALEQSGLTMAEFCRRRGLAYATVASWRGAARRRTGAFVEVDTTEPAAPPEAAASLCVELTLPGGAILRVYQRGAEGGAR